MNKIKYLLLFILLISIGFVTAANVSVNFKDASGSALTKAAIDLECVPLLGGAYTTSFPTSANRWRFQWYKDGGDGVISPINADGTPGGDDIIAVGAAGTNGFTQGVVSLSPGSLVWAPSAATFAATGNAPQNTFQGDRIYVRIFNANTIAQATKSMTFTNLYTIGTGATQVIQPYIPSYAWGPWVAKTITPLVSGAITCSVPGNPISGINVACTGQSNFTTTSAGTFNFSVPTNSNITITPTKSGYFFTPANRTYNNVTEPISTANFVMTKASPNLAVNPVPAVDATNVSVLLGALEWDFTLTSGYSAPTGFKVYFPYDTTMPVTVPYVEGVTHYTFEIPQLAYNTVYSWKVVPTNSMKGESNYQSIKVTNNKSSDSKSDTPGAIVWSFTTKAATIIYPGINAGVDFDGAGSTGMFIFSTPSTEVAPTTPQIVYLVIPLADVPELPFPELITSGFAMSMTAPTTTTLTVTVPSGIWYVNAYYSGRWHHGTPMNPVYGPTTVVFTDLPFGGKDDIPIIFTEGDGDPGLPVTLSSFTAIYSVGFFVQLTWVVQSETNHLGYNILRSQDDVLANAVKINPSFVSSGSASGTQVTYNYRDDQIDMNSTYNYWLESVDLDGTTYFFGPVNVIVNGDDNPEVPPVIPTVTELLNAYPNPFNPMTLIPYTLKSKGEVKIDIYNVKGELVRNLVNETKSPGSYHIPWNGKDSEGKSVSSGIYYYRMSSGKYTASKKIILVK